MTNDAKLGLVCGVCLVMVVAVMFFHDEIVPPAPSAENTSAVTSADADAGTPRHQYYPVKARPVRRPAR